MTSVSNAEHYVRQGRARWIKRSRPTIWFIESDYRHQVVLKHAGDLYSAGRDVLANRRQRKGLPTTGEPDVLLNIGHRGKWSWIAAVNVLPMQNINNNAAPAIRTQLVRARYARP